MQKVYLADITHIIYIYNLIKGDSSQNIPRPGPCCNVISEVLTKKLTEAS